MDLPGLEPDHQILARGHPAEAGHGRIPSPEAGQIAGRHSGRHDPALSQHPSHHLSDGEPGHLLARNLAKDGGGSRCLEHVPPPHGEHHLSAHRTSVQEGGPAAIPAGPKGAGMAESVTRLVLPNHSNHCYMNTVVKCVLWSVLQCNSGQVNPLGHGEVPLRHVLRHAGEPMHLMKLLTWKLQMSGWRQPNRQHDASEFFAYMCARLQLPDFRGEWVVRQVRHTFVWNSDMGSNSQAIMLAIPSPLPGLQSMGPIPLQQLMDIWSSQSSIHALRIAPRTICLQLGRFLHEPHSRHKDEQSIGLSDDVCIPLFAGGDLLRGSVCRHHASWQAPHVWTLQRFH